MLSERFNGFLLFSKGQSMHVEDVFSQELKGCPGQSEFSAVHRKLDCAGGWFSPISENAAGSTAQTLVCNQLGQSLKQSPGSPKLRGEGVLRVAQRCCWNSPSWSHSNSLQSPHCSSTVRASRTMRFPLAFHVLLPKYLFWDENLVGPVLHSFLCCILLFIPWCWEILTDAVFLLHRQMLKLCWAPQSTVTGLQRACFSQFSLHF